MIAKMASDITTPVKGRNGLRTRNDGLYVYCADVDKTTKRKFKEDVEKLRS